MLVAFSKEIGKCLTPRAHPGTAMSVSLGTFLFFTSQLIEAGDFVVSNCETYAYGQKSQASPGYLWQVTKESMFFRGMTLTKSCV